MDTHKVSLLTSTSAIPAQPTAPSFTLPIVPAKAFLEAAAMSRATLHRRLKDGHLTGVHLEGKLYITRDSIDRMIARAVRGELASPALAKRAAAGAKARSNP